MAVLQSLIQQMYSVTKRCGVWHHSSGAFWCWWEHMASEGDHWKNDWSKTIPGVLQASCLVSDVFLCVLVLLLPLVSFTLNVLFVLCCCGCLLNCNLVCLLLHGGSFSFFFFLGGGGGVILLMWICAGGLMVNTSAWQGLHSCTLPIFSPNWGRKVFPYSWKRMSPFFLLYGLDYWKEFTM